MFRRLFLVVPVVGYRLDDGRIITPNADVEDAISGSPGNTVWDRGFTETGALEGEASKESLKTQTKKFKAQTTQKQSWWSHEEKV